MNYVYAAIAVLVLYVSFASSKIIYAVYFSDFAEIQQEDKIFGQGEELRYIAAGDSIALGLGASSVENTFTYRVAESLGEKNKVVYKNIAIKGMRTKDFIEEQLPEIIAFGPDIVVITIGGNDATRLKSRESILDNYNTIIKKLEDGTEATIYISNIPRFKGTKVLPEWYISLIERKYIEANKNILALDGERVKIIDAYGKWQERSESENILAIDGFHANDKGYILWAESFLERIES